MEADAENICAPMKDIDEEKVKLFFSTAATLHQNENAVLDVATGQSHANIYRNYFTTQYILKFIGATDSKTILDFGCGVGRISILLAKKSNAVEAVDTNEEMIFAANKNFSGPANLHYHLLNEKKIPFAENLFDTAFSHWVFQHISDDESIVWLQEIKRTLNPGGRLFLFEQVKNNSARTEKHFFRSVIHYQKLFGHAALKLERCFPVMRVPSRGMWLWNKMPSNKLLLPICLIIDKITLNRKPEVADYFTYCFVLTN